MARLTVRVGPLDGGALRTARTDTDRTIQEVADEAQISKGFLTKLELGYSEYMSRRTFRRLATALRVAQPKSLLADPAGEPEGQASAPTAGAVPDLRDAQRPAGEASGVPEPGLRAGHQ